MGQRGEGSGGLRGGTAEDLRGVAAGGLRCVAAEELSGRVAGGGAVEELSGRVAGGLSGVTAEELSWRAKRCEDSIAVDDEGSVIRFAPLSPFTFFRVL